MKGNDAAGAPDVPGNRQTTWDVTALPAVVTGMKPQLTEFLNVRIPPDLGRRLDRVAARRSASRGSVVRAILEDGLSELEVLHERWAAEVAELRRSRGESP